MMTINMRGSLDRLSSSSSQWSWSLLLLLSLLLSGGSHVYVCRQIDSRIRHLDSGRGSELLSRSCWQVEWVNSNLESGKVLRITSWSPGCSLGGCSSGSLRTLGRPWKLPNFVKFQGCDFQCGLIGKVGNSLHNSRIGLLLTYLLT